MVNHILKPVSTPNDRINRFLKRTLGRIFLNNLSIQKIEKQFKIFKLSKTVIISKAQYSVKALFDICNFLSTLYCTV